MKRYFLIFILFLSVTAGYSQTENEFWKHIQSGSFEKAAQLGEKLAEENIDYLYLSAVCRHINYDYELYHQMSEYYMQQAQGDIKNLTKLLIAHADEQNYHSLNFSGIVKQVNPQVGLNAAAGYFEKSLQVEEKNPVAYNYLSMIHIQNGQKEKGIEFAKKAISYDKTFPEPYNNLAFGLYQSGDIEGAVDQLIKCMQNCPRNTISTYINSIQLACQGSVLTIGTTIIEVPVFKKDEDRLRVIKALKDHPENYLDFTEHFLSYNSLREVGALLDAFEPTPETTERFYFLSGITAVQYQNPKKVDEMVDKLFKTRSFDAILEIGNAYTNNYQFEEASAVYEKILPIATQSVDKMKVISNHGAAQLQLQHYEKAIRLFEKALKIAPKDDITLTNIGIAYALKEDKVTAKKYLLKAKENCTSDHQMQAIDLWLKKVNG